MGDGKPSLRFVLPRYGEAVVGGSETLVRALATELAARGWGVTVWTTTAVDEATWRSDLPAGEEEDRGVAVRRFTTSRPRHPRAFHQGSRIFFRLPPACRPEAAWLRAQGPYAPGLLRALAADTAARGLVTVLTPYLFHPIVRGIRVTPRPRLLIPAAHDEPALRLRAVRDAVAASDGILYHSIEERELLEGVHPVAADRPSAVGTVGVKAPPSADAGRFRRDRGIDAPYILHGGRAATGKGVEILLDGFRRLRDGRSDARLVLAGEAGRGLRQPGVELVGRLSREEWWDAIAGAAAVAVPGSLESLSLLALEAWAAGRPCLVNRTSAVLRGQGERSGGALDFDDAEGFAAAADRLLGDPELGNRLGTAGRDYVSATYGWDAVEGRLRDLIDVARRRAS